MRWRRRADGRLAALKSLPELMDVATSELRGLLAHFDEIAVPAGAVLARAGRPCTAYVVVLDGCLETWTDGRCRPVPPGGSCGWDAMRERSVNPTTVIAASDARLLVMGRAQFRAAAGLRRQRDRRGELGRPNGPGRHPAAARVTTAGRAPRETGAAPPASSPPCGPPGPR